MFAKERYPYSTNSSYMDNEFESVGPKGVILKVARFTKIGENLFNFGFGDLDIQTGEISDTIVSNNADDEKILMTVASIIYEFTDIYAGAAIFIRGTTHSRTRRYQMGINKFWSQINPIFEVFGLKNEKWEYFSPTKNYDAFLGRRKSSILF